MVGSFYPETRFAWNNMLYHDHQNHSVLAVCLLVGLYIAVCSLLIPGCRRRSPEIAENTVALVNGEPILRTELEREALHIDQEFSVKPTKSEQNQLYRKVLHQMIQRRLLLQAAQKNHLLPTPEQTRKVITDQTGGMTRKELGKMLNLEKMTYDEWTSRLVQDWTIRNLIDKIIDPTIQIPREERIAYYQKHQEEFRVPKRVKVRQIVLSKEEEARKVRKRLTMGHEDFALVAQEVSLSPDANRGGDLGIFSPGQMPPEFDKVCFSLEVGEISPVVQSPYGYHIFLVEKHLPAELLPFKKVEEKIHHLLLAQKREKAFSKYQQDLWNRSKITLLLDRR